MKLIDNGKIVPMLENAKEVTGKILEVVGAKETEYADGVMDAFVSIEKAFKQNKDFVEAVPVEFIWDWVSKNPENNSQVILMMADYKATQEEDPDDGDVV